MTPRPPWDASIEVWEVDGSLRDLYVNDTTLDDWSSFIAVASTYSCEYSFEGRSCAMPSVDQLFANRGGTHLLAIHLGAVTLNCHFFTPSQIELDIDPREVKGPGEHESVLDFVESLAQSVRKTVWITPENVIEVLLISYDPTRSAWTRAG